MYQITVDGDNGWYTLPQKYADYGEAVFQARLWKRAHRGRAAMVDGRKV